MTRSKKRASFQTVEPVAGYDGLLSDVVRVIENARRTTARSINMVMTATYWLVGRRIVEREQQGERRAVYGESLLERLAEDLTRRFGRGFSGRNLRQMRAFYIAWPNRQALSADSAVDPARVSPAIRQTSSAESDQARSAISFPLPWSHYARLLQVQNPNARAFYETEALRGGWTVRQLDRQIASQFYERTALSRNKVAMLRTGSLAQPHEAVSPEEEIKNPNILEFIGLKGDH
jgi:hypothetical protein